MAALGRTLCRITKQRWLSVANINRQSLPLQSHFFLRKEVNFSSQVDKPKAIELTDPTKDPEYAEAVERFRDISDPEENWYYHGYNPFDREEDTFTHHNVMFLVITVSFVGIGFILAYLPDKDLVHWKQREAYLELARREANGLPLIDPNLVPPEKLLPYLPTDEELGDTEVII